MNFYLQKWKEEINLISLKINQSLIIIHYETLARNKKLSICGACYSMAESLALRWKACRGKFSNKIIIKFIKF